MVELEEVYTKELLRKLLEFTDRDDLPGALTRLGDIACDSGNTAAAAILWRLAGSL